MSGTPRDDEPFVHDGPALSHDGTVEGRPSPAPAPSAPPPAASAPLELAEVQRAAPEGFVDAPVYRAISPPARGGRAAPWVVLAGVLLVAGGFAALRLYAQPADAAGAVDDLLARPHGTLLIDSQPPGATIRIGGETVGETPWAGDGRFPAGATVELTLAGHQPFSTTLKGAAEETIHATLRKAAR